jgi:phosphoglycerol transferase MdoB-like AlkP superfamily enzyme
LGSHRRLYRFDIERKELGRNDKDRFGCSQTKNNLIEYTCMKKFFSIAVQKFKEAITAFLPLHIVFASIFIVLRFVEIGMEWAAHGIPKELGKILLIGLVKDIAFVLTTGLWLFILYYLVFCLHKKIAKIFYIVLAVLLCSIQLALSNYFVATLVPLGSDLWTYSMADIKQTVGAAGIKTMVIIGLIVAIGLIITSFVVFPQKIKERYKAARIAFFIMLLAQLLHVGTKSSLLKAKSEQATNLSINKSYFFYKQTLAKIFPEEPDLDIYADSYINDFGNEGDNGIQSFQYVDEENYPFLHKENTADVLSPFFNKSVTAPNIVIILTEGLGRAFSNSGAYLGSFTPFLDSLSQKSLYWEDFMSQGGRTFAVLPSLLGSLPFAKNGFCELADKAPDNLNLINLLKANGYSTSFSYGGDSHFDFMDVFLKRSNIDKITDIKTFPSGYAKMPASASGFSWGYGDKELFRYFLSNNANTKPSLDVLLTVSTHNPFLINEQEIYINRFEQRMKELGFDESKKLEYRSYQQQYASILYTDDALRNFFTEYAKRVDFSNTVFIITGDHRMPEIPLSTKADRYHVPLIVYSPLLSRTAKFSSISTHFDIAPTIMAWLNKQYNFSLPSYTSWLGNGIDTNRIFRNIHNYPLMQTKDGVNAFILGNQFLDADEAFEIGNNMSLAPVNDAATKSRLKAAFESFKQRNNKIISGSKLIPDSIYQKYSKK